MVRLIRLLSLVWLVCCAWAANPTSAKSAEPVRIGAVLPFSGGVELYGGEAKLGLDGSKPDGSSERLAVFDFHGAWLDWGR